MKHKGDFLKVKFVLGKVKLAKIKSLRLPGVIIGRYPHYVWGETKYVTVAEYLLSITSR